MPLAGGKTFQRPVDCLGMAEMIALGELAANVAAGAGFVFAVYADRDELNFQLAGASAIALICCCRWVLLSMPRAKAGAELEIVRGKFGLRLDLMRRAGEIVVGHADAKFLQACRGNRGNREYRPRRVSGISATIFLPPANSARRAAIGATDRRRLPPAAD